MNKYSLCLCCVQGMHVLTGQLQQAAWEKPGQGRWVDDTWRAGVFLQALVPLALILQSGLSLRSDF